MSRSDAGKGDRTRPFNRKKWDKWWDDYEKGKKDGTLDRVQEDSQQVCNVGSKDKIEETNEKSKQDDVHGSSEAGDA